MKTQPIRMSLVALTLGVAALAASPAYAEEAIDTVWLANGGRVRGAVMVDDAKVVSIKLADGKTREIARAEVMRVEYAGTAAAAEVKPPPTGKPKPQVEDEAEEDDSEAAAPRKKKKRRDRAEDVEESREQREADETQRQRRLTGAKRMIGAGAALTAIGWAAVVGGLVAAGFGAANGDGGPLVGGGLVAGFSLPLAITGSVLLGVGVRSKRDAQTSAFVTDERSNWDVAFDLQAPLLQLPPLSLQVTF